MSKKRKIEQCATSSSENKNESIYLKPTWDRKLLAKADRSRLIEGEHCDWCGFPFNCMTPAGREPFRIYSSNTGKNGRGDFCCLPCAYRSSDSDGGNSLGRRFYISEKYPDAHIMSSAPTYAFLKRFAKFPGCLGTWTYQQFFDCIERRENKAKLEMEQEEANKKSSDEEVEEVVKEAATTTTGAKDELIASEIPNETIQH